MRYQRNRGKNTATPEIRNRNVIWFSPRYSSNAVTKVGKYFVLFLYKHFPFSKRVNKIFKRNIVKVTYNCMYIYVDIHLKKLVNTFLILFLFSWKTGLRTIIVGGISIVLFRGNLSSELNLIFIYFSSKSSKWRSSHPEVFLRKYVLKKCSKCTGQHPCQSVISIKFLKQLYWNRTSVYFQKTCS